MGLDLLCIWYTSTLMHVKAQKAAGDQPPACPCTWVQRVALACTRCSAAAPHGSKAC